MYILMFAVRVAFWHTIINNYLQFKCPLEPTSQFQKKKKKMHLEVENLKHGGTDYATFQLPIISFFVLLQSELDKICFGREWEIYWN